MSKKNLNSVIIKDFSIKPIAYNPALGFLAGKATAGIFMCQILYWWGRGAKKEYIYKTIEQMKSETNLTRAEQDTAIRIWKELGVIEVVLKGIPPKRHFKIDVERVYELLDRVAEEGLYKNVKSSSTSCESDKRSFDFLDS